MLRMAAYFLRVLESISSKRAALAVDKRDVSDIFGQSLTMLIEIKSDSVLVACRFRFHALVFSSSVHQIVDAEVVLGTAL